MCRSNMNKMGFKNIVFNGFSLSFLLFRFIEFVPSTLLKCMKLIVIGYCICVDVSYARIEFIQML